MLEEKVVNSMIDEYRFDNVYFKNEYDDTFYSAKSLIQKEYNYYLNDEDSKDLMSFDDYFDAELSDYDVYSVREVYNMMHHNDFINLDGQQVSILDFLRNE